MKNEDRISVILLIASLFAGALLVLLSFSGCGDKTTTNNYASDNSYIETNETDVQAGGDGSIDQSEQPDNSVDNSNNSDNSDNSVDNSDSSTSSTTQ